MISVDARKARCPRSVKRVSGEYYYISFPSDHLRGGKNCKAVRLKHGFPDPGDTADSALDLEKSAFSRLIVLNY